MTRTPLLLSNPRYEEQRLSGLREHAARQRQATLERLQTAVATLREHRRPITVLTVREVSGLDYKSIVRNPEALALFQANSTFLVAKRKAAKRKRAAQQEEVRIQARDPALNYSRAQLVARLRQAEQRRLEAESLYQQLLLERTQVDLKVMQLEAELGKFQDFLSRLRSHVEDEENSSD
jgi:hypothetical protein